jgi:protein involved in polysaccharide export with SLBB domain
MRKRIFSTLLLLFTSLPFAYGAEDQLTFPIRSPRYTLRPGDIVDISFRYSPALDQSASVQPDGFLSLREIGELNVQGMTIPELSSVLSAKYSAVLNHPEIFVSLKHFDNPHVVVTGQVAHPGRYDLPGETKLSGVIGLAGGLTPRSKHSDVLVIRQMPDHSYSVKRANLKKIYAGNFAEDIYLQPDDLIVVPQNKSSKIREYLPPIGMGLSPQNF